MFEGSADKGHVALYTGGCSFHLRSGDEFPEGCIFTIGIIQVAKVLHFAGIGNVWPIAIPSRYTPVDRKITGRAGLERLFYYEKWNYSERCDQRAFVRLFMLGQIN